MIRQVLLGEPVGATFLRHGKGPPQDLKDWIDRLKLTVGKQLIDPRISVQRDMVAHARDCAQRLTASHLAPSVEISGHGIAVFCPFSLLVGEHPVERVALRLDTWRPTRNASSRELRR